MRTSLHQSISFLKADGSTCRFPANMILSCRVGQLIVRAFTCQSLASLQLNPAPLPTRGGGWGLKREIVGFKLLPSAGVRRYQTSNFLARSTVEVALHGRSQTDGPVYFYITHQDLVVLSHTLSEIKPSDCSGRVSHRRSGYFIIDDP